MFSELFSFKSLFPSFYRLVMAAIVLLIAFFVVDAAIELALAPDHSTSHSITQNTRRSR